MGGRGQGGPGGTGVSLCSLLSLVIPSCFSRESSVNARSSLLPVGWPRGLGAGDAELASG